MRQEIAPYEVLDRRLIASMDPGPHDGGPRDCMCGERARQAGPKQPHQKAPFWGPRVRHRRGQDLLAPFCIFLQPGVPFGEGWELLHEVREERSQLYL